MGIGSKKLLQILDDMYQNKPFQDENGNLVYVPDPIDKLINACGLFENQLYNSSISSYTYDLFIELTLHFLLSIPLDIFKEKVRNLEYSSREILLRNLDKIVSYYPDKDISAYSRALLF